MAAPILDTTISFLKEDSWQFAQVEGRPILEMGYQGDSGKWTCYAQAVEEDSRLVFYSICPVRTPQSKLLLMAEFLTRANFGLVLGNFELDMEDGEIRFKTSIDVEGDRLTPALVRPLVYASVLTMDKYLPGIMKLIYSDAEPAEVAAQIEEEE